MAISSEMTTSSASIRNSRSRSCNMQFALVASKKYTGFDATFNGVSPAGGAINSTSRRVQFIGPTSDVVHACVALFWADTNLAFKFQQRKSWLNGFLDPPAVGLGRGLASPQSKLLLA